MLAKSSLLFLSLTSSVFGHGYVREYTIDGANHVSYLPYDDPDFTQPTESIARSHANGINPLFDPLDDSIACGQGSYPAPLMANVTAGGVAMVKWTEWPHSGPIYSYMARCPNGQDCSDFNGTSGNHWFKIEEHGIIEYDSSTGRAWATQKMFDADKTWNITIPSCLAPGPYVIRHETMAIQASQQLGGAQFYPQCAQVWVSGGTDTIEPALVSLPGDIQPDDPGVLFDRAAAMESGEYTCP
ncbi:Esterase/lipase/thioesterase [Onygenales sp. PD_40]|nr:Esterase/lipase/thioesterase [Onygenales sp. PD_40]KAK2775112.1 Esterase/lipase/thioesterase [Emmonsiellopsis sp. PD_33]KAK2782108.1 Esterase/lipase/thioesterase [Onygenales sp. PD_12]